MAVSNPARSRGRTRWLVIAAIVLGVAVFVGANAHLIYVSFASQPACVDHAKPGEMRAGQYSAAKSSC
ncbi:hypothetical protein [Pelagibacterium lacus]|uniref:Uncharacterized protein n=1 Tax=Pelagibacterium lacus TaxID=2282655 RepID=A0A369W445_9HYPH|nr:hypothetical protein [Pelagibacterium lacus]RDE08100.1 hypothetical protein DVH29_13090 [Pelagibacterium lacus]